MPFNVQKLVQILSQEQRSAEDIAFLREAVTALEDFNIYVQRLSSSVITQLLHSLKVEEYAKNQVIFNKGDKSDKLYVICSGSLDIYDVQQDGDLKYVSRLSKGKLIGERGLARRLPRSLSAVAHKNVTLLTLSSHDFRLILESSVLAQLEEKRLFLLKHLPCMESYSKMQLERVAYVMELDVRRRGENVVCANETYEYVSFIKEGTAAVINDNTDSVVIKLEEGSAVADECAFMNLKSRFTVVVQSDIAKFYKARRGEFMSQISTETFQQLKSNCQYKLESHLLLKSKSADRLPPISPRGLGISSSYASPQAQRSMQRIFTFTLKKRGGETINTTDYAKCKLQLEMMRDCTSSRLKKFSREANMVKRFKMRPTLPRDL